MSYFEEPIGLNPKYPCGICLKNIANNHRAIRCNLCNYKIHIKCNKTDVKTYEKIIRNDDPQFCLKCKEELIPFQKLSDQQFLFTASKGLDINLDCLKNSIFPSKSLKMFFTEINYFNQIDNNNEDDNSNEEDNTSGINCNYVDIESFNHTPNKKDFSLFHLNIASLSKHKDELETILTMINYKFDIMGITETKLKKNSAPIIDINIEGYNCFSTPTEADKGGALIYVADKFNNKPRKDLDLIMYKANLLESIFIEIINLKSKNVIIGCIYRHPSMDVNYFNNDYLQPLLEKLSNEDKKIYLMGDFNIDLMNTYTDLETSSFFDNLTSNLFVPHIIIPTRITETSKTLIDNIFSNSINFQDGISGNLTLSISDHLAQFLIIPDNCNEIPKKSIRFKRDTRNFDKTNFNLEIANINWSNIVSNEQDVNQSFNLFEHKINELIDKYIPLIKTTKKDLKQQLKPWITLDIQKSIARREKLRKKYIKAKNFEIKEEYHKKYKDLRNHIVMLCRQSKKNYYQNYFTENANNIRNTWKGIKTIINIKDNRKTQPTSLIIDKEITNDPKKIANEFNKYFSSIASQLQNKIYKEGCDFSKYLENSNEHNFFIKPTNKHELIIIINKIITNKASGPHSVPNDILHLIKQNITEPLAEIINLSFVNGTYFNNLKISKVLPFYKDKGSKLECKNYRPISLLSNINKIIEKIMYNRLYNFLEKFNCIYENQFGFRSHHSTNHALISLTEDIRNAIDDNKFACGVFIDLQKAFDTVDHEILLKKLEHYGIRGISNNWFRSYLTNRKQFVSINGFDSNEVIMKLGVPQGSVLGPLLFLIYINDLNIAIKYCKTTHFADDTNLVLTNHSPKKLQKQLNIDLRLLTSWLRANKISLNSSKTELIIFRHPNKPLNYDFKIKINGKKLIPSRFVKYLGILIDSNLNWSFHIEVLTTKLSRAIGMLSKIRHYVSKNTLRMIYFGIFSSLLTYGSQIWGQTKNKHVKRIENLQNKAIRVIHFAKFNAPSNQLYKESRILKLSDHIKLQNFMFVYNCTKKELPTALLNNFNTVSNIHNYNTRGAHQHKMVVPKVNTQLYGIQSITFQSVNFWNFIVSKYRTKELHLQSKSHCKNVVTNFFLENYA